MLRSLSVVAALGTTLALAVSSAPAGAAAPAGPDDARRAALVRIAASNDAFSPNGDGSKDRGIVKYRLGTRAKVTVKVTRAGKDVLERRLGTQRAGTHAFVWNGKRAGGKIVRDGRYRVTVVARTAEARRFVRTPLVVKARYGTDDGRLLLSSSTVYPRTTVVDDAVVAEFASGRGFTGSRAAIRLQVRDTAGRLVDAVPAGRQGVSETWSWDGRTSRGSVAPAGAYRLRLVRGDDAAGNPRILAPGRTVRVSPDKLVASTTKVDFPAPAASWSLPYDESCNGCPEVHCNPTPSQRFAGGLSFRSVDIGSPYTERGYCYSSARFGITVPGRSTPGDTVSVTARGGPTTAGAADQGVLSLRGRARNLTGDTAATLTAGIDVTTEASRRDVSWNFGVDTAQSYDVASFDVEYTTYVPAS